MGHHLSAFIARPEVLAGLAELLPGARMLPLAQGLWFAPVPQELRDRAMEDAGDDGAGPGSFIDLVAVLEVIGARLSHRGDVAWMESDWFGGMGDSAARLWRGGEVVIAEASVNEVLRALGVQRVEQPQRLDEWDSVGLGEHRSTDRCFERAQPVSGWQG